MTTGLPSHLWISALASFGIEQVQGCRLQKTHQEDQLRLTDRSVREYLLSMNSVVPCPWRSTLVGSREGTKFASLWKDSHALPLDIHDRFARWIQARLGA